MEWIQDYSNEKPKTVFFLSGDDADAKRKLARALEETGFIPVDIGGLIDGGKTPAIRSPAERVTHWICSMQMEF